MDMIGVICFLENKGVISMKFYNIHFLVNSQIRGNKNSRTIMVLTCLLVVALTIVSSFAVTIVGAVDEYKEDYKARSLYLSPFLKPITQEAISAISSVEHVETVADVTGMYGITPFVITETSDEFLREETKVRNTFLYINCLYDNQEKSVIQGKTLDSSPAFCCLVPSAFYPFEDAGDNNYENLEYIDGTTLIGKTITIKGYKDRFTFQYYTSVDGEMHYDEEGDVSSPEFTLNVVGTYYCKPGLSGNFRSLYVSRETDLLMTQMAIEGAGIDLSTNDHNISKWWNTPSMHGYYVVVDDYSNISSVFNEVIKMGYDITDSNELYIDDSTIIMANLFGKVGVFMIIAIAFISIVILIQSSTSAIRERKGFIGLMKAIGYKNRQVFSALCLEHLYLTIKAFIYGAVISGAIVAVANCIFSHGTYQQMKYIVDLGIFLNFLGLSLLIAIFVPVVCQLVLLNKLVKIQPKDAMSVN